MYIPMYRSKVNRTVMNLKVFAGHTSPQFHLDAVPN